MSIDHSGYKAGEGYGNATTAQHKLIQRLTQQTGLGQSSRAGIKAILGDTPDTLTKRQAGTVINALLNRSPADEASQRTPKT